MNTPTRHQCLSDLAAAMAKASSDHTTSSVEWDGLGGPTQDRFMVLARLAMKMEEDSRP